jgi:citrate synthase
MAKQELNLLQFAAARIPGWAKQALDEWTTTARITDGKIFRRVSPS